MNQKDFLQKSSALLDGMSMEELRNCLHNIARKTKENQRAEFMQLLQDCCHQVAPESSVTKFHLRQQMSHDAVRVKLAAVTEIFSRIEDCLLCLSAQGHEDYSNGYCLNDWVWEYEDKDGIGRAIEEAALLAYACVNDGRYAEALSVFELIMGTQVLVEDESSGDSFDLGIEELVEGKLVGINLRALALNVLYAEYQLQPAGIRAESLFSYFRLSYFKDIHIEDIFSVGREELRGIDLFFQSWIDYLMQQSGEVAARLLREGALYFKGTLGLVEAARRSYKLHPSAYMAAVQEYEKAHDYENMKEIGKEALENLEGDRKLRGEIALKVAQASRCINDMELMKVCWYEAFYSNSTVANYLRIFVDADVAARYRQCAEKRIDEVPISAMHVKDTSETAINELTEIEHKSLSFFAGHFDRIKTWCLEDKRPLGWSGRFIKYGVDLLLLHLYAGPTLGKAGKKIAGQVAARSGFHESQNLVFMQENPIFATEASSQKGEEIFWDIFCRWKGSYTMTADDAWSYVEWLESVIDKRIEAIIGGKYRNKYGDVALLAAALGEVKESLGAKTAKKEIVNKYLSKYPRHSAFRDELRKFAD